MNKIIIFLFLITVFIVAFLPVKDTDFGWHYRCGNQFLTQNTICLKNDFSYFLSDYRSAYSSTFYDIILAFIYNQFGFIGISILGSLILTASALIFIQITSSAIWITITGFFLSFFLSFNVFGLSLRPQVISWFFFLLTLFILNLSKKNKYWLLSFPILFFIWVNTHIGFFLGIIILSFSFFNALIKKEKTYICLLILAIILSFISTLNNPFGFQVYIEIVNHSFSPLNKMIAEWVPPVFWQLILIIILTIFSIIVIIRNKTISFFNLFLIIFFSLLSFQARRNLPFFYTSFFYVILNNKQINYFFLSNKLLDKINQLISFSLISFLIFFSIVQMPNTFQFNLSWDKYCQEGITPIPCLALKKYPHLSGNVYNAYEWGGFLIWQKPEIKVFVDGRMPAWKDENGKSPYQVYLEIIQAQPGWNEKLKKLKTNYLLIQSNTFLDQLLKKEADIYQWKEVYRDKTAVIFKKI